MQLGLRRCQQPVVELRTSHTRGVQMQESRLMRCFQKANLTRLQINNPKVRITVRSQIKFLDVATKALNDEFFGLDLAQAFDLREIGLLYYVIASSELPGDALQRCAHYSLINNEGVHIIYRSGKQVQRVSSIHHLFTKYVSIIPLPLISIIPRRSNLKRSPSAARVAAEI
jgi:hypothetical protein